MGNSEIEILHHISPLPQGLIEATDQGNIKEVEKLLNIPQGEILPTKDKNLIRGIAYFSRAYNMLEISDKLKSKGLRAPAEILRREAQKVLLRFIDILQEEL